MTVKPQISELEKLIKGNDKLLFIQDVYQSIGVVPSTFYKWFPKGSSGYNKVVEALELNKTSTKREIRDRLLNCKTPVGLIALYRLLGTPEERKALNQKDEEQVQSTNREIKLEIE